MLLFAVGFGPSSAAMFSAAVSVADTDHAFSSVVTDLLRLPWSMLNWLQNKRISDNSSVTRASAVCRDERRSRQPLRQDWHTYPVTSTISSSVSNASDDTPTGPWAGADDFWVGCTHRPTKVFLLILTVQHLYFFISTCFQLQKVSVWLGNSMLW